MSDAVVKMTNEILTATIKLKGAELCSLKDKAGVEYIWKGDNTIWGRHAPVLFPIVGKVKENTYRIDGKTYPLSQHGFARDRNFSIAKQENQAITFSLAADETSLAVYPYKFELLIQYQLIENRLAIRYEVRNTGTSTSYFSIGAHPGFTCPLPNNGERSDYALLFSHEENSNRHLLEGGLFNGVTEPVLQQTNLLPITKELFDKDALVFKDLKSDKISIIDAQGDPKVSVDFAGFPYMGIWSKSQESPFVCIEPWFGIADQVGFTGDFSEKEGIQSLEADEVFSCEYGITIH